MQRFDVLVVGAGPAGSATAHRLAAAGVRVLVADRATFPRDKPCGGGLTTRALKHCPVDPTPVVEDRVDFVELRFRFGDAVVRDARGTVIWMTQRRRLDAFLLDAAREQGAEVREGAHVRHDGEIRVERRGSDRGCRGRRGRRERDDREGAVARHRDRPRRRARGERPLRRSASARYRGRAIVEFADIPGGYGWVFPKGDHVNVGVGAWAAEGPRLREHLARVCAAHGLDRAARGAARTPAADAPARGPCGGRARAARRRCGRADRPGLR